MKTNYIRAFAIFASILMMSIIAVPMVAAEDEYETCLDATKICDETHAEIKELFTELDIAIANYNQASKDGLHTYEYAEEIDAITKELAELGKEVEIKKLLSTIILNEDEKFCEEIDELLYKLEETVAAYNEAVKQRDTEAQIEYFKEIKEIVSELQTLGIDIEIIGNLAITVGLFIGAVKIGKLIKTGHGGWQIGQTANLGKKSLSTGILCASKVAIVEGISHGTWWIIEGILRRKEWSRNQIYAANLVHMILSGSISHSAKNRLIRLL